MVIYVAALMSNRSPGAAVLVGHLLWTPTADTGGQGGHFACAQCDALFRVDTMQRLMRVC